MSILTESCKDCEEKGLTEPCAKCPHTSTSLVPVDAVEAAQEVLELVTSNHGIVGKHAKQGAAIIQSYAEAWAAKQPAPLPTQSDEEWECFCDAAYFDLWAVRRKGAAFQETLHLHNKDEAEWLTKHLNSIAHTPLPDAAMREALEQAEEALKFSTPDMAHYAEPLKRHEDALVSVRKALAALAAQPKGV